MRVRWSDTLRKYNHLYKRNATYYARMRIPSEHVKWLDKIEFKRSLRRKCRKEARKKLPAMLAY